MSKRFSAALFVRYGIDCVTSISNRVFQDIVYQPVTTPCSHNVCFPCLERSFSAGVFNCPSCRAELGKDYLTTKPKNEPLKKVLNAIFPGYEVGC